MLGTFSTTAMSKIPSVIIKEHIPVTYDQMKQVTMIANKFLAGEFSWIFNNLTIGVIIFLNQLYEKTMAPKLAEFRNTDSYFVKDKYYFTKLTPQKPTIT